MSLKHEWKDNAPSRGSLVRVARHEFLVSGMQPCTRNYFSNVVGPLLMSLSIMTAPARDSI